MIDSALPPDIVKSSGPLIIGYLLSVCLYGVVSNQVYYYYMAFPKDRLYCKIIVFGVYILETIHTILVMRDAYMIFGPGFGSFEALDRGQYTSLTIPILSGIIASVVQVFYAYRINLLSRRKAIGYIIITISALGFSAAMVAGPTAFKLDSLSKLTDSRVFMISVALWWGCSAACDVVIASSMVYLLSRHDSRYRSTHLMITKLMRLTIETGTATATVALLTLILFFSFPKTNYSAVPVLVVGTLYCNTLLVLFNSRMRIAGGREELDSEYLSVTASNIRSQPVGFPPPSSAYLGDLHSRTTQSAKPIPLSDGSSCPGDWTSYRGCPKDHPLGLEAQQNITSFSLGGMDAEAA